MKTKFFKSFLLAVVLASLPQLASASDFMLNGLCYNYNSDGTSVTVTSGGNYTGAVNIPSTVTYKGNTYSVTSIGGWAFSGCSGLTSVTIPNSVTTIGGSAFYHCTGLTSVTIPNSVTSIGIAAFEGCSGLTNIYVDSNNVVYDSRSDCNAIIETATNTLISGCKNTIIPNSVTDIGEWAFSGCSGLTSVTIPNSVTSIGNFAFYGCSGLTSVTIPNSVTYIGQGAFYNCTGLTSVTIPTSVTEIGDWAFYGCSGLTSVTIPNSVITIGQSAFYGCTGLTEMTLTGQGAWYPKNNMPSINIIKTVNIGCGITELGYFGFTPDVVNCYAETPPVCSSGTFANYDGELHVPTTSIASYFMADYWQNFNNMVNDLSKVTLDKDNANINLWETLALIATVTPEGEELIWSTNNPSVATVDENGLVTATGGGECDIYATLASSHDAAYAKCHITVSHADITLSLSEESIEMSIGDEQILTATITPNSGVISPTWSSSDESVATVANGKVTAIGEGECDITATVLDQTATCHVIVTNNVTITLNIDNAIIGASQMLTVYPSCSPDVPVELVVTSSDPSVALARVVNRSNAPAQGMMSFPEKGMALKLMETLFAYGENKSPALASEKAIMILGVKDGTATITVTTADGKAVPAVLELRVVDVNGDNTCTSSDVTALYNYILYGDESAIINGDVNGDGSITSSDVTAVYNIILGL